MVFQKPFRELSIGETLSWTFGIYSRNIVIFYIPVVAAGLITAILTSIIRSYITFAPQPSPTATPAEVWSWFTAYIAILIATLLVTTIVSWIISSIANGIVVKCASDLIERGSANLRVAFNLTVSKLLSLLAATIVSGILILAGLLAFVIPGIILYIMFYLIIPAIIIENTGALESLSRSRRLVSHRWLKTFAFLLVVLIIISIATAIVNWVLTPLSLFGGLAGSITSTFLTAVLTSFIAPISPIAITVYYYAMLAKEQPIPPPPPPPV